MHLSEGFDFLGFNIRRYAAKLLIKPSTAAIRRLRKRLATEMRRLRGSNAGAVLARLNPIIRGWAAYYRGAVSSKTFGELDDYAWKLTWRWAKRSHSGKPKGWVTDRYFWFFSSNNVEMVVKAVNGCGFNTRYWVFAGGLTNVNVVMTVTDTHTGAVRNYVNGQGTPFQPNQDTGAFVCP